jgi:hypothetical protein
MQGIEDAAQYLDQVTVESGRSFNKHHPFFLDFGDEDGVARELPMNKFMGFLLPRLKLADPCDQ